jgi:hypothetical protein
MVLFFTASRPILGPTQPPGQYVLGAQPPGQSIRGLSSFCNCVGFEILTAVGMKSSVFWGTTPCNPLKIKPVIQRTVSPPSSGSNNKPSKNQHEAACKLRELTSRTNWPYYLLYSGFLVGLPFNPEDGGEVSLQNDAWFSADYTALYLKRWNSFITIFSLSSVFWESKRGLMRSPFRLCVCISPPNKSWTSKPTFMELCTLLHE